MDVLFYAFFFVLLLFVGFIAVTPRRFLLQLFLVCLLVLRLSLRAFVFLFRPTVLRCVAPALLVILGVRGGYLFFCFCGMLVVLVLAGRFPSVLFVSPRLPRPLPFPFPTVLYRFGGRFSCGIVPVGPVPTLQFSQDKPGFPCMPFVSSFIPE